MIHSNHLFISSKHASIKLYFAYVAFCTTDGISRTYRSFSEPCGLCTFIIGILEYMFSMIDSSLMNKLAAGVKKNIEQKH